SWRIYHGSAFPQVLALYGMTSRALTDGQVYRPFSEFAADCAAGDLPTYVFVEPDYGDLSNFRGGNSQHPVGNITDGDHLIRDVYEPLRNSPLWDSSALLV